MSGNPAAAHPAQVTVRSQPSGLAQQVAIGSHQLRADEPEPDGADSGPAPYDLLLASLGSCTAMTLRMYADRKGWPLEQVTVDLYHDRIHARDCADCETEHGYLDRIQRRIQLAGDLSESQQERLMAIADRCPVHRTLKSEVLVETSQSQA